MQHLLARARWDADGVRGDLHSYVTEHLGDPDGMLAVDETGDLKKGSASAHGVAWVRPHGVIFRRRRRPLARLSRQSR